MALVDAELLERLRLVEDGGVARLQPALGYDAIRISEALTSIAGVLVVDRARINDQLAGNAIALVSLRDAFRFAETLSQAHSLNVDEAVGVADQHAVALSWRLIEKLGIVDSLGVNAIYQASVAYTLRLADTLARFFAAEVSDAFAAGDTLLARAAALGVARDGIGIAPTLQPMLLLNVVVDDDVAVDDEQLIQMLFNPTVVEGIAVKAGYLGPNGSFTTWAMNTRTGAVTEYADFTFNSLAKVGRSYFGASEDGLYELRGDDDDGDDIIARIRGGYLQFGGPKLSRLKEAYIAARGEGDWVLRVLTGDGEVYNYAVTNRSMRSTKVHMGKGQRARYFAYELISAGQDFDLDTLEFVPLVVQRRV